jgi:hypothetical protein
VTIAHRSEHWKAMRRSIFPEVLVDFDVLVGVVFGVGTVVDL